MRKLSPGGHWGTHTLTCVPRKYPPVSQTQLVLLCVRTKREPCTHTLWRDDSAEPNGSQSPSSKQCVLVIEIRSWEQTLTQGGQDTRPQPQGPTRQRLLNPEATWHESFAQGVCTDSPAAAESGGGQLPAVRLTLLGRPRPCHREAPQTLGWGCGTEAERHRTGLSRASLSSCFLGV